jgi:hypothetical protein
MAASGEAAGSAEAKPLAVVLCGPLDFCRLAAPATTVAYANLPSAESSCRLLWEAISLEAPWRSDCPSKRWPGAGRRLVVSSVAPALGSFSAFLFARGGHSLVNSSGGKCGGRKGLLLLWGGHSLLQLSQVYRRSFIVPRACLSIAPSRSSPSSSFLSLFLLSHYSRVSAQDTLQPMNVGVFIRKKVLALK